MDQHRLYRTIQQFADAEFRNEEQLLAHVLHSIIKNEEIPIKGGRIWKIDHAGGTYKLIVQHGEIEGIKKGFRLRILDYPMFLKLARKTTIVGTETDKYLRQKGIKLYSATGVGEQVRWKGYMLYPYVIAINAEYLKDDMTYALNIISSALTNVLKRRRIEKTTAQLQEDLDKARELQKSILPEHEVRFSHYDVYGVSLPDRIVGGDFFDYLQATGDKDRLSVVIGDAASKGISAAAQAMYVSGALRMGVEYQTKISSLIGKVNALVNKTFLPEHFVSLVYAELNNNEKGPVFYVNAGHSTPILLHSKTQEVEMLPATGQIIGPFPGEKYNTEITMMKKGDLLLLYTDGVSEAFNERKEMYGVPRLTERLKQYKHLSPKEICQLILEDVQKHASQTEYSDDKTLIVIKRGK
jgi:sigma-B regulation protein RsbU (phosphoserine phosphatase)